MLYENHKIYVKSKARKSHAELFNACWARNINTLHVDYSNEKKYIYQKSWENRHFYALFIFNAV